MDKQVIWGQGGLLGLNNGVSVVTKDIFRVKDKSCYGIR